MPLRYVCVHGHFYQPPRENPWLETVELQESAAPYHDWNERITSECYAPNGASRITNLQHQIVRIVNNYSRMSFNFGPTLLSWLADFAPRTYRMIQDADVVSAERYSGHGSALAQVYNHIIMPLASRRDALTQIRWGIVDFEHRFGRRPEGMWLAETAVSREVLDLMAQEGIKFTILAPSQCARVRPLPPNPTTVVEPEVVSVDPESASAGGGWNGVSANGSHADAEEHATPTMLPETPGATATSDGQDAENVEEEAAAKASLLNAAAPAASAASWTETPNASVDSTQPYLVQLDQGRSIAVFFYDGPTSRAIAFEGLLSNGEKFGGRLVASLHPERPADQPQLAHVATDGESYGHHHRQGEMALSYALHWIDENKLAQITNYGEFLERFPPRLEAEVNDNSSWSCSHGVERWRSDCGCNGGKPGWNQRWRGPLREALDLLRDKVAPLAEAASAPLLQDFWAARDAYIHVILDRSRDNVDRFLAAHATRDLSPAERVTVFELLELQRHAQLMYTSCGWFFDEISGLETVQIIAYAGRVLQLAAELFGPAGVALEADFLEVLSRAQSNVPDIGNGAEVYRRFVTSARLDLEHVGAHYAISSMFRSYPDFGHLFCFDIRRQSYDVLTSGRGRFALGRASLRSRITEETEDICFAVLHLGDQNLSAAVKRLRPPNPGVPDAGAPDAGEAEEGWKAFVEQARVAIRRANLPELIRLIDSYFQGALYSLTSLFSDEQQRILKSILDHTLSDVESSLMRIYEEHATLLDFLAEARVPTPPALAVTAGFALNASLRRALEAETYDRAEIARLLRRAEFDHVTLDSALLGYTADRRMKRAMVQLEGAVEELDLGVLNETREIAESLRSLPMEINLWQAQNIWNDLLRRSDSSYWSREWREGFHNIGVALNISVEELVFEKGVRAF